MCTNRSSSVVQTRFAGLLSGIGASLRACGPWLATAGTARSGRSAAGTAHGRGAGSPRSVPSPSCRRCSSRCAHRRGSPEIPVPCLYDLLQIAATKQVGEKVLEYRFLRWLLPIGAPVKTGVVEPFCHLVPKGLARPKRSEEHT